MKVFQISDISRSDNGLFVMGHVNDVVSRMIIDTGGNVTIIKTDLARKLGDKIIWTPFWFTLQTVTGNKIKVYEKVYLNITFGDATYHHLAYVADVSDQVILRLDFLPENNFKIDFENNELHSSSEDIAVFETKYPEIKQVHKITAKYETTIPPRSKTIIPGTFCENNFHYGLIDYPITNNNINGGLVASSLVDLSRTVIPERVANVSGKAKVIKESEVLATCIYRNSKSTVAGSSDMLISEILQSAELN